MFRFIDNVSRGYRAGFSDVLAHHRANLKAIFRISALAAGISAAVSLHEPHRSMKRELISRTAFVSELQKGPLVGVKYSAVNVRSFDTIAPNHRGMEERRCSRASRSIERISSEILLDILHFSIYSSQQRGDYVRRCVHVRNFIKQNLHVSRTLCMDSRLAGDSCVVYRR